VNEIAGARKGSFEPVAFGPDGEWLATAIVRVAKVVKFVRLAIYRHTELRVACHGKCKIQGVSSSDRGFL
jgi:hypothetical protein